MANWIDIFVLLVTISIFGGIIYGIVFIVNTINAGLSSTKESLKSRGLDISSTGVAVKTSQRYTREDQLDATQRHFIRAVSASSFRKGEAPQLPEAPPMSAQWSNESNLSTKSSKSNGEEQEKKKRKRLFGSSK